MKNPFFNLVQFIDLPKRLQIHYLGPRWAVVGAYMLTIYLTLPLTPIITQGIFHIIGKRETGLVISTVLLIALGMVVGILYRRIRREQRIHVLFPFMAILLVAYNTDNPSERIHLLEYGFLAFLVFRAMGEPRGVGLLWAYVTVVLLGFSDECIQFMLPNRYFDLGDVALNGVGAACGIWLAILMRQIPAPTPEPLPS
ncbi:MAG: VanZ family protein [Magnetococcales bacterium]|nr:VanZ family protein [Magnetococcales bacterium]